MNKVTLKAIGLVLNVVSFTVMIAGTILSGKKMELGIAEEVAKQLGNLKGS